MSKIRSLNKNGLIHHWPLSEASGNICDDLAGGADLSWIGTPVREVKGINTAQSISPSNYLHGGRIPSLDFQFTDSYSISLWFKATSWGGAIVGHMLGQSTYTGWDIWCESYGRIAHHLINQWPSDAVKVITYRGSLSDSQWHHVVITYNGNEDESGYHFYIDGLNESHFSLTNNIQSTVINYTHNFILGRRDNRMSSNCDLRDLRIYNRVINIEEIQFLSHNGITLCKNQINLGSGLENAYARI